MNCHQNSYKRSLFWDYWMTLHVILFDLCQTASCWCLRFNLTSCFHIQRSGMQLRDSSFSLYDLSPIDFISMRAAVFRYYGHLRILFCFFLCSFRIWRDDPNPIHSACYFGIWIIRIQATETVFPCLLKGGLI